MNHHTPSSSLTTSSELVRRTPYTEDDLREYVKVLNLLPHVNDNNGAAEAFLLKRLSHTGVHIEATRLEDILYDLHELGMVRRRNLGNGNRPYYLWSIRYTEQGREAYRAGRMSFEAIIQ